MCRNSTWLSVFGIMICTSQLHAQLTVTPGQAPDRIVNEILVGQGVSVSNIVFNGVPLSSPHDQLATFDGMNSNIGLRNGLVLCTGRALMVQGPNNNPGMTSPPASPNPNPDPDLRILTSLHRNAVVLEFDFVASSDSISFRFVFGSEEYNEFVCSMHNDVFGFFLSGPGIEGNFTNNAVNIGTVPGTQIPISVNSINNGTPGVFGGGASTCNAYAPGWQANHIYYVDNTGGNSVQLDGFTVPMVAGARVQCGQTYHIKFALAHAGDVNLDSAVLIEGESFSAVSTPLLTSIHTPIGNGTLMEGCAPGEVTLTRADTLGDLVIAINTTGAGITPEDFHDLPTSITIPAGSRSVTFPISAVRDDQDEGEEEGILELSWTSPCGGDQLTELRFRIVEHTPITVWATDHALNCELDSVLLEAFASGGLGELRISWSNGAEGASTWVSGTENATYQASVTDECPETEWIEVRVDAGCDIVIPNVFTPNGDGVNDTWSIAGLRRWKHSVRVFNRWGQVVFESENYANNWRGGNLPDGTYYYEVISERSEAPLVGHVTILGSSRR